MRLVRKVNTTKSKVRVLIGGTFDPVHYGHLRTALEVRNQLGIDTLGFLPAGEPPHRDATVSSATHRLAMLKLAIAQVNGFTIDERELQREGPSYMVDTLRALRAENSDTSLVLVVGQDSANSLQSWHQWQEIFTLANLVFMNRPGDQENYPPDLDKMLSGRWVIKGRELLSRPAGSVMRIGVTGLSISSSGIRKMLQTGVSPQFLLPEPVLAYIREQGLYS